MIPALRSEFKKLLTVRSTYVTTALVLLFVGFIAFYVEGWRLDSMQLATTNMLSSNVFGALTLSVSVAIVAILMMTHEYRYNTIMHTLTNSNSRSKVLLAKILTISCYAIVMTVSIGVMSAVLSYWGVHAAGHSLGHQVLNYKDIIWRSLFFGWSYGMAGLLIATLLRSQVGSIAILLIMPAVIEPLLSQLVKSNSVYLPFTSQAQVVGNQSVTGASISPAKGALVFSSYLLIGWIVAWILFLRRDAN